MLSLLRAGWHDLTHRPASQEPALDALRAAAILLVICAHYSLPEWPKAAGPPIGMTRWPMFYFGWTGLDLFFVLSGLLIGTQLWRELDRTHTIDVPRFLLRRGLRIWPLYAVALIYWASTGHEVRWPDLTFLSNYFYTPYTRDFSLSTEEQFYLIAPFLLLATARLLPPARRWWPIVALLAAVPVMRVIERHQLAVHGISAATIHEHMINPIHLHSEGLIVGLLLAWLVAQRHRWIVPAPSDRVSRRALVVIAAGLMVGMALDIANKEVFAFTALGLIYGVFTYAVLVDHSWLTRPLRAFAFYPVARLSYGMYLNHFLVIPSSTAWAIQHVPGPLPVVFVTGLLLGIAISTAAAALTFLLVEYPFLVLRGRMLSRPVARNPEIGEGAELIAK